MTDAAASIDEPDLCAQANEVELQRLGLKDLVERATAGKLRRPPEGVDRMRARLRDLTAASRTLAGLAAGMPLLAIATAPQDGSPIIGARLDKGELRDVGKYAFNPRYGWIEDETGELVELTCWWPLPAVAARKAEAAA